MEPKYRGRARGTKNGYSVVNARRAIAEFVDGNLPRFNEWLNHVANGIPATTKSGQLVFDSNDCPVYLVKPDPLAAIKVVADITEYHLPKLSRQDVSVTAITGTLDSLSPFAQELLLMTPERVVAHLEQTHEAQRVPAWLRADTIDVVPANTGDDDGQPAT